MDAAELARLTIHEARSLLNDREISSVELTKTVLERVAEVEDRVKAFVTVNEDLAIERAENADERIAKGKAAPLTGIPMQLKDNMATRGVPTTCSSRMLENYVPPYDSTVAQRLYDQSAVLVGKGNLDEFAMGSSTENSAFFPTRNPWDLDRVPGGSSGGPAAAVAASECFYSLGSDTGGSIRQPASLCGVVGLKPTYGLVSRYGLVAFASSLDQIGPIAKDVTDCALVMNAIAGHDPDETPPPSTCETRGLHQRALGKDLEGLRIGVPIRVFRRGHGAGRRGRHPRVNRDSWRQLGAEIVEMSLPHTSYALAVYYILAPSECSANLARYDGVKYGFSDREADSMWEALEQTRGRGFGPEVKRRIMLGTYALSAGYYDAFYLKAQRVRTIIRREFESAFEDLDAIVSATSPTVAFELGAKTADPVQMYLSDVLTLPANIAGISGISVPAGMSDGLPVGLQILGKALGEETIFRIAHAFEQATDWRKLRPNL